MYTNSRSYWWQMTAWITLLFLLGCKPSNPPTTLIPSDFQQLEPQLQNHLKPLIQAVVEDPFKAEGHSEIGIAFAANDLWAEAYHAFSNYVTLKPKEPLGYLYLGISTDELGDQNAAYNIYKKLTEDFPKFAPAHYRVGEIALKQGDLPTAKTAFLSLQTLEPDAPQTQTGLAEVLLRENQAQQAIDLLEKARRQHPEYRIIHQLLGSAYRTVGDLTNAEFHLALGLNSIQYPLLDAWGKKAGSHMKTLREQIESITQFMQAGKIQEAFRVLNETTPWHPKDPDLLALAADLLLQTNQPQQAHALLSELVQNNPQHLQAHYLMAEASLMLGQNEEAENFVEQAIAIAPTQAGPYLNRAAFHRTLNQPDKALLDFKKALELDPQNYLILVDLGDLAARDLKDYHQALSYLEQAVALRPVELLPWQLLVQVYYQLGQPQLAQNALTQCEWISPDHPMNTELKKLLHSPSRP